MTVVGVVRWGREGGCDSCGGGRWGKEGGCDS